MLTQHLCMMSWLRTLLKVGSRTRKLVGSDLAGNQYFEQLVEGGRPRRSVKMKEISSVDDYTPDSVPPEWDRWLRGLRRNPPSDEEMITRVKQGEILKHKVTDIEKRDAELREKEIAEGLVAGEPARVKAVDHASAPSFKSKSETNKDPTSTGKDFQPGSWKP